MKVTTSCSGRFHIFDQAAQLHRHGLLHRLITDYPKFITRQWGIPDDKAVSLLWNGVLSIISRRTRTILGSTLQSRFIRYIHDAFSRRLAAYVPPDTDVFIGLSSFCLEAIERAKQLGITAIVDHGSLHLRTEYRLLSEEAEFVGLPPPDPATFQWAIDKENAEFQAGDRVLVLSKAAKRTLVAEGVAEHKVLVNSCGVNLAQFSWRPKQDAVFRIVQCGGLNRRKGVHYLLRAFRELQLPGAELWFVGDDPRQSELAPVIKRLATENVRFIGRVHQSDLAAVYNQASVFVLASIADGFGMVVPQAMACGLPVIVTENVGAADIVTDGIDGFVIPIRDVDSLKEKLLLLYREAGLRSEMGAAAAAKARTALSWDGYGDRLASALREVARKAA